MTETLTDAYTAGTSPEDFVIPDLPDDLGDVVGPEDTEDAPWGYTTDPETGQPRPKKAPGRPRKPPGAEELEKQPPVEKQPDREPARPARASRKPTTPAADDGKDPKMPRGGVIAAGVNKLYRRAGKFLRVLDEDLGQALIYCSRIDPDEPEDERELTVGEAWENLARSNPRVRAWLLKAIAGGEIGDLLMAHAPLGIALVMKPWVQRLINPDRVAELMMADEEDEAGEGPELTREDIQQMQDLTQDQAMQMARAAAAKMRVPVTEAQMKQAADQVRQQIGQGDGVPPAFRRQQPKNKSRAQRTGQR